MSRSFVFVFLLAASLLVLSEGLKAQAAYNPYHENEAWDDLGEVFGPLTGGFPDPDGRHMWLLGRCGSNNCADSDRDAILKFDLEGNLVDSFGAGVFAFTHGFDLDDDGYFWVTEGAPAGDNREAPGLRRGLGHQVHKVDQQGNIVMSLGEAGVHGCDGTHFNGPADVVVAPNGDIWVADGHRGGNNRLVKFSPDGDFLLERGGCVGSESKEPGMFDDPHAIAMDSQGRVFVGDRGNSRIQIFDQQGNLLAIWTQFGKPSGIVIDSNDVMYVVDGLSGLERPEWRDNPGWEQGIRIGDARTGWVRAFVPNRTQAGGAGIEFIGVDMEGNMYANDLARENVSKYVPFKP